jgi:lipid II isoglutaminyl synthase (glutamine-hydrolysing)
MDPRTRVAPIAVARWPSVRRLVAITAARLVRAGSRLGGHRGTALPGLVAARIWPEALAVLASEFDAVIVVIGTNGKTTTARLVAHALERAGRNVVANRSGSNLRQGILSTLIQAAAPLPAGEVPAGRVAVLEIDELSLERVLPDLPPPIIVATNLFRDQLDRYGEPDAIVDRWIAALVDAPPGTRLVWCADDPRLSMVAAAVNLPGTTFGLAALTAEASSNAPDRADEMARSLADPVACRACGAPVVLRWASIGHLGAFACPNGHLGRRPPEVAVEVGARSSDGTRPLQITGSAIEPIGIRATLPGLPNAYNVAAAVAATMCLGLDARTVAADLEHLDAAFGRLEEVAIGDRRLILGLVKNPVSLTELGRLAGDLAPAVVLLGLNDAPADGRDVSWVWDASLTSLVAGRVVALTGSRVGDLILRLKYGSRGERRARVVSSDAALGSSLDRAIALVPPGGLVLVAATYTAILGLREILQRRGLVAPIPR